MTWDVMTCASTVSRKAKGISPEGPCHEADGTRWSMPPYLHANLTTALASASLAIMINDVYDVYDMYAFSLLSATRSGGALAGPVGLFPL